MKVSITLDSFPMKLLNMMIQELAKYLDGIDVQAGGETVFVTFSSDDIVKIQECCIIVDKYNFGGGSDGSEILLGDKV